MLIIIHVGFRTRSIYPIDIQPKCLARTYWSLSHADPRAQSSLFNESDVHGGLIEVSIVVSAHSLILTYWRSDREHERIMSDLRELILARNMWKFL